LVDQDVDQGVDKDVDQGVDKDVDQGVAAPQMPRDLMLREREPCGGARPLDRDPRSRYFWR
jgi:hypothetical protein